MNVEESLRKVLKSYMYRIAGINQMVVMDKRSGNVLSAFSKFSRSENIQDIAGISQVLLQVTGASNKQLDFNTIEFGSGEKLFTVNGGERIVLTAVSDKNAHIGLNRMYLKEFARKIDEKLQKVESKMESRSKNEELSKIFSQLSSGFA